MIVRIEWATANVALLRPIRRARCWYCALRYVCRVRPAAFAGLGQRGPQPLVPMSDPPALPLAGTLGDCRADLRRQDARDLRSGEARGSGLLLAAAGGCGHPGRGDRVRRHADEEAPSDDGQREEGGVRADEHLLGRAQKECREVARRLAATGTCRRRPAAAPRQAPRPRGRCAGKSTDRGLLDPRLLNQRDFRASAASATHRGVNPAISENRDLRRALAHGAISSQRSSMLVCMPRLNRSLSNASSGSGTSHLTNSRTVSERPRRSIHSAHGIGTTVLRRATWLTPPAHGRGRIQRPHRHRPTRRATRVRYPAPRRCSSTNCAGLTTPAGAQPAAGNPRQLVQLAGGPRPPSPGLADPPARLSPHGNRVVVGHGLPPVGNGDPLRG